VEAAGAAAPAQAGEAAMRAALAAQEAGRVALTALGLPVGVPPAAETPTVAVTAAGPVVDALRGTPPPSPPAGAAAPPAPAAPEGAGAGLRTPAPSTGGAAAPTPAAAAAAGVPLPPAAASAGPPPGAAAPATAAPAPVGDADAAPPAAGGGVGPPATPPGPPAGIGPAAAEPPDDLPQRMVEHGEVAESALRRVEGAVRQVGLMASWATLGHARGTAEVARAAVGTADRAIEPAVAAAEAAGDALARTGPVPARVEAPGVMTAHRMVDVVTLAARLGELAVDASRDAAAELGLAPVDGLGDDAALVDSPLATTMREAADEALDLFERRRGSDEPLAAASQRRAATAWEAAEALLGQAADVAARAAATVERVAAAAPDPSSRAATLARRADAAARVVAVLADNVPRRLGGPSGWREVAGGASMSAIAAAEVVLGAGEVARLADEIAAMEARAPTDDLRVFEYHDDAAAYGRQVWAAARQRLTDDQRSAFAGLTTTHGTYGWPGFRVLYATCRGRTAELGVPEVYLAPARESIALIDEAVRYQPVPEAVLVVREIFPDTFDRRMEELVGSVQQDPAFLSTALTAGPAYDASRPVVLHLRVPAGTPALYLADVSDAPHEQELLLGRGVRYRVVDTRRIAGRWHVYGEVLEEGAP
jgi:hypothetical protein